MNPKQKSFVEEYLIDLNATQAAIRAGYSKRTANEQGARLLANVSVAEAVGKAMQERSERTEITQDMVLKELALIGFANAGDYFEWGPDGITVIDRDNLTREQQAVVAEVSQTTTEKGGTIRVKLHDKKGALVDIARHLGMFPNKHEVTGKGGEPIDIIQRTIVDPRNTDG